MAFPKPNVIWPGNPSVTSLEAVTSHGIMPGIFRLGILPGSSYAMEGTLVITDGLGTVAFPGCRVDNLRRELTSRGWVDYLSIVDRRWRWRQTNTISGWYNQRDKYDKLLPRTIRSPKELAILCLQAMGETNYLIDMPPGLPASVGYQFSSLNPPWIGVNPITGTNPAISWDNELPAVALANLCDHFGRRVVYQALQNRILIVRQGAGKGLPAGSISQASPALDLPAIPNGIGVIGAEIRYQCRIRLEPVGREWNGHFVHINQLSYAPNITEELAQIDKVTVGFDGVTTSIRYNIIYHSTDRNNPRDGLLGTYVATSGETSDDVADGLATNFNAAVGIATAEASGPEITITGSISELSSIVVELDLDAVATNPHNANNFIHWTRIQDAVAIDRPWEHCGPPDFTGVINGIDGVIPTGTDRLTYSQARDLAQKHVYRYYRIKLSMPDFSTPFKVPGYPVPIQHITQLIPEPTKVEQILPGAPDLELRDENGFPILQNFYNGYSRDKPAEVFGAVYRKLSGVTWVDRDSDNTRPGQRVTVPFTIDTENQLVIFDQPVVFLDNDTYQIPDLILETAFTIRNASTNQVERFSMTRNLPGKIGKTDFVWRDYRDIQVNVLGRYNDALDSEDIGHPVIDPEASVKDFLLLEADPLIRAKYYLDGMQTNYLLSGGQTNHYNGILAVELDGALSQISWHILDDGAETVVSRNTEHSLFVPPFPERRRFENLPAVPRVNTSNPYIGQQQNNMNPYSPVRAIVP